MYTMIITRISKNVSYLADNNQGQLSRRPSDSPYKGGWRLQSSRHPPSLYQNCNMMNNSLLRCMELVCYKQIHDYKRSTVTKKRSSRSTCRPRFTTPLWLQRQLPSMTFMAASAAIAPARPRYPAAPTGTLGA